MVADGVLTPSGFIDVHVHLEQFDLDDGPGLVERARSRGVTGIVGVGTTARSVETLLRWKERFPEFVNIAVGLHPELSHTVADLDSTLSQIHRYRNELVAIGEVGLPHYSGLWVSDPVGCLERATAFADASVGTGLPLIVHAVHDAAPRMLVILQSSRAERAVFHWLKARRSDLDGILSAGYFVSVTPRVDTRAEDQLIARIVPSSRLLLETDAPEPYGEPSEPADVIRAVMAVAEIRAVDPARVAADAWAATMSLFPALRADGSVSDS